MTISYKVLSQLTTKTWVCLSPCLKHGLSIFLYKYQALPIYMSYWALTKSCSEWFFSLSTSSIWGRQPSTLISWATNEEGRCWEIKLCHHGTTIWSPWEICHFYSSLHSGHYLQGVPASKVNTILDKKKKKRKGRNQAFIHHLQRQRLLTPCFEQLSRITCIHSSINTKRGVYFKHEPMTGKRREFKNPKVKKQAVRFKPSQLSLIAWRECWYR